MKKPTMQEVADALNISRVTAWKVFNNQPGVSDTLRRQVIAKAKEIGYTKHVHIPLEEVDAKNTPFPQTVSVVVSRPESSLFWMNIIHQIAKELNKSNINLLYTYLPSKMPKDYALPATLTMGSVQGIIVLNVYDIGLIQELNKLSLPKVFLDTVTLISPDSLTGDLLLLEGEQSVYKITKTLIENGLKEIGFIGDINYARTNMERHKGFLRAMKEFHIPVSPDYCLTSSIGIDTYAEEINEYLRNLKKLPQAFVCVSDFVAHFLLTYLNENNYKVPQDIKVSGFDGSTEYLDVADYLTTVPVETKTLGKRLVNQLLYRIKNPSSPLELVYLYTQVLYGESTKFY